MNRVKLITVIVSVIVIAGFGVQAWYNQTHLLLSSVTPRNHSKQVTTTDPVVFTFNKPLDGATLKSFKLTPTVAGTMKIDKNQLTFTPTTPYAFGIEYTAGISQAFSTDGKIANNLATVFKPGYVGNPSKAQLQQQLSRTDSMENTYPILKSVPHETLDYKIDYRVNNNALVLQITLYAILNRPDQYADYQQQLKTYKKEALDYIRSVGEDPSKLTIEYLPAEATNL